MSDVAAFAAAETSAERRDNVVTEDSERDDGEIPGPDGFTVGLMAVGIPLTCVGVGCLMAAGSSYGQSIEDPDVYYDDGASEFWSAACGTACSLPIFAASFFGMTSLAAVFGLDVDWSSALWAFLGGGAVIALGVVAAGLPVLASFVIAESGPRDDVLSSTVISIAGAAAGTIVLVSTTAGAATAAGAYWGLASAEGEPDAPEGAAAERRAPPTRRTRTASSGTQSPSVDVVRY